MWYNTQNVWIYRKDDQFLIHSLCTTICQKRLRVIFSFNPESELTTIYNLNRYTVTVSFIKNGQRLQLFFPFQCPCRPKRPKLYNIINMDVMNLCQVLTIWIQWNKTRIKNNQKQSGAIYKRMKTKTNSTLLQTILDITFSRIIAPNATFVRKTQKNFASDWKL